MECLDKRFCDIGWHPLALNDFIKTTYSRGESTFHWWKSKLQMSFTLVSTVRIPCLWFHTQCRFWAWKAGNWEGAICRPFSDTLFIPSGVECYSIVISCCLDNINQVHTWSSHCSRWGNENFPGMLPISLPSGPASPLKREEKKDQFLGFSLLSIQPFLSLPLLALSFPFSPKPWSSVLDIEATETLFSNLMKLYWWFNSQPILRACT